jgi:serine/threonine protein kinase
MNCESDKYPKSPEKTDPGSSRQQVNEENPEAKKKNRKAIGNYTYHEDHVIGWGYTSKVYKGRTLDKNNPLTVAIKKISITNLDNLHLNLLQNEIKIVKKLKHPNVVMVYDILSTKKNCYIIMELCEGGSLEKYIKNIDSVSEKTKIITDLCSALNYLVSIGVVHRDIKPGNILRTSTG